MITTDFFLLTDNLPLSRVSVELEFDRDLKERKVERIQAIRIASLQAIMNFLESSNNLVLDESYIDRNNWRKNF